MWELRFLRCPPKHLKHAAIEYDESTYLFFSSIQNTWTQATVHAQSSRGSLVPKRGFVNASGMRTYVSFCPPAGGSRPSVSARSPRPGGPRTPWRCRARCGLSCSRSESSPCMIIKSSYCAVCYGCYRLRSRPQ